MVLVHSQSPSVTLGTLEEEEETKRCLWKKGSLGRGEFYLTGNSEFLDISPLHFKTWGENYAASTGLPTTKAKEKTLHGKAMNPPDGGLQVCIM